MRLSTSISFAILICHFAGCTPNGTDSVGDAASPDAAEDAASPDAAEDAALPGAEPDAGSQTREDAATPPPPSDAGTTDVGNDVAQPPSSAFDLRADPDFTADALDPEVRLWWERMHRSMVHEGRYPDDDTFSSGDLYLYARPTHTYLQSVLLSLRATSDPAFLDEAVRVLDLMRDQLRDEWYDTLDGTDGTTDGYLNWTYQGRGGDDVNHNGKDVHESNELKTHAIICNVVEALDANRGVESPAQWDYAEESEYWRDYLLEHFIPKWEERDAGNGNDGALLHRPHTHTTVSNVKLHDCLARLEGNPARAEYADRMIELFTSEELVAVSTPYGDAYVWPRTFTSLSDSDPYLHPMTYARYVIADVVHFTLEGYHVWEVEAETTKFARALTAFVYDDPPDSFASSIGGDEPRGGYSHNDGFDRQNTSKFGTMPLTHILPWDDTGELYTTSLAYMEELDDLDDHYAAIPMGGFLFYAAWTQ